MIELIRKLREIVVTKGVSKDELGKVIGVQPSYFNALFRDERDPSIEVLLRIREFIRGYGYDAEITQSYYGKSYKEKKKRKCLKCDTVIYENHFCSRCDRVRIATSRSEMYADFF